MGIRVLVVDDDKDLLTLIEKFLVKEQPDFDVVSTISAQDAVRKLEEEHFDAIVCDYYLGVGEMNGLELLEWLRASNSNIPFIMFTGRSREEVAIRALNLGADLYLKKDQEDLGNLFVELVHHIKSSVESVQMEKTLRDERSRFQEYLDVAGVMIVTLDLDGTVTLVNRRGCKILGYDLDEIIGKNWFKTFIPKRLRKEVYRTFTSMMKGDVEPEEYFENPVLTRDGEERIIAWYKTILTDESGKIVGTLSSGEDITERMRAEEALKESENLFRDLAESTSDWIWEVNSEGVYTLVSGKIKNILGYTVEEVLGRTPFDLMPSDESEKILPIFSDILMKKERIVDLENWNLHKDGHLVCLLTNGVPILDEEGNLLGYRGVDKDITERKKAEEALRESESRFRTIFEQAPMGVARVGLDGTILQGNRSLALMLGYDTNELVGINVFDISTREDEKIERRFSQELLQGTRDSYEMEKRFIRKDGEEIWGILSVSVVSDLRGEPIFTIGMVENITPRKKAEEALRGSQQLLQRTFDGLSEAVFVLDADPAEIVDCNLAAETVFGYSRDEMLGQKTSMLHVDEATYEEFRESLYLVIEEKGFLDRFEFRMKRRDGTVFSTDLNVTPLMNEQGTRVGWVSVVRDVTERKKAEDALRESEKRFRTVFEQAAVGVTVVELDDNIIETNPFYQELVGYSANELVAMKIADITHPDDAAIDASLTREVLDGKRDYYSIEKRYIRKTGEEIWVKLSSNFVKDEEGVPEFCIGIVEDITERKKAEEVLRESEKRYRVLVETMNDGLGVVDENKRFTFVNNCFAEMLGYSPEEMIGQPIADFAHGKNLNILAENIEKRREGFPSMYELTWITKTGEEVISIVSGSSLLDIDGTYRGSFAVITDITGRKRAEEALLESEQRNRMIVDAMSDLVFVLDSTGRYSDFFAKDDSLLVRPWNEVKGRKHEEILPPDLAARYNEYGKKVRENGESITFEYELEIGSALRWFQGTMMLHEDKEHIVYAVNDITERKLAEVNLRQSEKKYHSIFDNTPVGLTFQEIVVDESGNPIDFVFIDVNEGFEALMGLRKDDIIGKSASHVLTSSGEPTLEWIDVYGKVALTGARARFDQYSEALGRWFSVTAYSPEKNYFITAYTDITEQKKGYENLKQQKKELSDFAHMMSHDLNSYFFKIRGSILLLGTKDEFPEIRGIKLLTEEMIDLVQHSVALADAGLVIDKKHKVNLGHLVRDVAVRHLPEGVALVQGQLQSVMADEIKLIQIFQNLFDNAVEHGNPTTVEVQRYDSKEGVRIVVLNDGKPIPTDSRPKVFQRGFTTKDKRKGYGLSIVKKLVEAHGWQIKLADTPETAFEILIPSAAV